MNFATTLLYTVQEQYTAARWVTHRVGLPIGFGRGSDPSPMGRVVGDWVDPFSNRAWVW